MILDDIQALAVLKTHQQVPPSILKSRTESAELFALQEGDKFLELLIEKIEHIESEEKQQARKKYSRNVTHMVERLLRPVDNVYSATGGSKLYNIENEKKLEDLLSKIGRLRSGKSLQEWLQANWMPLYHSDPNGVIFLEYTSEPAQCWPTYKNIDFIRGYKPRGQNLEWILFEPVNVKKGNQNQRIWRLVDDKQDRTYIEKGGSFTLDEERSFEHPFGVVPALINSDIEKFKAKYRISPIDKVVDVIKEYARDQSIKTIYKKYNGFPTMWKYVTQCKGCFGSGKKEDSNCIDCDGHGYYKSKDVTDVITIDIPTSDDVKITPDIAGYITPPLDIWKQYNEELELLDTLTFKTHWGTMTASQQNLAKTATEIILNSQPMIDRLNRYADVAEMVEGFFTEMIANFLDPTKPKDERVASINYGRRYIIDPPDVILKKYEEAKAAGDNNVVLDRLLNEYFTAKYRNDPEWLRVMLLKAQVEPYLHLSLEQIVSIFDRTEAQRKVLFEDWWNTLKPEDLKKSAEDLIKAFDAWFTDQTKPKEGEE